MKTLRNFLLAIATWAVMSVSALATDVIVVSHGQANDPFWSVAKNGVDSATAASSTKYDADPKAKPEPYRVRISVPSFRNLLPLVKQLLPGQHVSDVPVIHWSLNYWAVEGDR